MRAKEVSVSDAPNTLISRMVDGGKGCVLTGLVGRGILASRTPAMHEAEGAAQGLRLAYSLFDFTDRGWANEDLPELLDAAKRMGFAGLNVTFPFKQAIIPFLDALSDGARAIGAVNSVAFVDGRSIGHNTDVSGFAMGFSQGLPHVAVDRVLQIGCGGAGAAVAHALLGDIGVKTLILFDRDKAKLTILQRALTAVFGADRVVACDDPAIAAAGADGLVNTTPMGMDKYPGLPITADAIEARHWVAEIVYFPLETAFLLEARRKGCRTLDGSGMAVYQAVQAFEIFTGRKADPQRMRDCFNALAMKRVQNAAA